MGSNEYKKAKDGHAKGAKSGQKAKRKTKKREKEREKRSSTDDYSLPHTRTTSKKRETDSSSP